MPLVKLILFIISLIVFALPVGAIKSIPAIKNLDDRYATIVTEPLLMISIFGALFLMTKMFAPTTISSFFLSKKHILKELLQGSLLGIGLLMLCGGILLLQGYVIFSLGKISIAFFFFYVLYFLIVAVFEELLFRTYPLFVVAEAYPAAFAVLINGLLFGLLHSLNPGFTVVAMINITLAGILFSWFTLYYRSINWAIGIHLGWNFAQGILLGYKVSGTNTPGVLIAKPIGANYVSGGEFGIEGSLTCTVILTLIIIYLAVKFKIEPLKEEIIAEHEFTRA